MGACWVFCRAFQLSTAERLLWLALPSGKATAPGSPRVSLSGGQCLGHAPQPSSAASILQAAQVDVPRDPCRHRSTRRGAAGRRGRRRMALVRGRRRPTRPPPPALSELSGSAACFQGFWFGCSQTGGGRRCNQGCEVWPGAALMQPWQQRAERGGWGAEGTLRARRPPCTALPWPSLPQVQGQRAHSGARAGPIRRRHPADGQPLLRQAAARLRIGCLAACRAGRVPFEPLWRHAC